jgi:hypothetical protein
MRIGVIVHLAIFKADLVKSRSEAADLLQSARADTEIDLAQLTETDRAETLDLLKVIRANLADWVEQGDALRI